MAAAQVRVILGYVLNIQRISWQLLVDPQSDYSIDLCIIVIWFRCSRYRRDGGLIELLELHMHYMNYMSCLSYYMSCLNQELLELYELLESRAA